VRNLKSMHDSSPFVALVGVASLVVAVLYLIGFSFRWSYYYNFGAQHIIYKLEFQTFLVAAFELLRSHTHFALLILMIASPMVALNLLLTALGTSKAQAWQRIAQLLTTTGLLSPLVIDVLRALIVIAPSYYVASSAGTDLFRQHLFSDQTNPLPTVTVLLNVDSAGATSALLCGADAKKAEQATFIGQPGFFSYLQKFYKTCNLDSTRSWRLLYRDDAQIIIFAAEAQPNIPNSSTAGRPLTLVLPAAASAALVFGLPP
jgi:hypothetical protein